MQNDVVMGKDRKYMDLEPREQRESVESTRRGGDSIGMTKQCSERQTKTSKSAPQTPRFSDRLGTGDWNGCPMEPG